MEIKNHQEVKLENLLCCRKKIEETKINDEFEAMNSFIEKNSRELFKISSATNLQVVDKWREVTKDFEAMSNDERLTIRLLIKDTFKEIRLHPLNRELETGLARELANARDKLMETDNKHYIDLTLKFHNGLVRVIRIDKYSGELIKGFDLNANVL